MSLPTKSDCFERKDQIPGQAVVVSEETKQFFHGSDPLRSCSCEIPVVLSELEPGEIERVSSHPSAMVVPLSKPDDVSSRLYGGCDRYRDVCECHLAAVAEQVAAAEQVATAAQHDLSAAILQRDFFAVPDAEEVLMAERYVTAAAEELAVTKRYATATEMYAALMRDFAAAKRYATAIERYTTLTCVFCCCC